jgi:uncharacterized protein (TIGR00255 family)
MSDVRSMTGFAALDRSGGDGTRGFSLLIKAVNHRHLDLSVRVPSGLDALELALRAAVKAGVRRGHVELTLTLEKTAAGTVQLDEAVLNEYAQMFTRANAKLALHQTLDLNAMLRLPGVLAASAPVLNPADIETVVLSAIPELLQAFNDERRREGESLAAELRGGMARLQRLAAEATELRQGVGALEFARLQARLTDLLTGFEVSEERLLAEAALLAARSDVEEELVRLRTHIARFADLLDAGGEVGRPLDFLLQEMNREANTALSKNGSSASEAGLRLTAIGLEMKVELERAREQVQNLE